MKRRSRIILTLGAVLVLAVAIASFGERRTSHSGVVIPPGERRPAIALAGIGLSGEQIDVAQWRGAPVVLNFWASWCGPCQAEQPALERAAEATRSDGVHFVGVNIREANAAAARSFVDDYKVSYPSVVDSDYQYSVAYAVAAPPATLILDAAGRIAARLPGELPSGDALVELIRQVAGEHA